MDKTTFYGNEKAHVIDATFDCSGGHPLYVSEESGLVFVKDRRPSKEIARVWSEEIFSDRISETTYSAINPIMHSRHALVASFIDTHVRLKNKKLVDFGAGEGQFLSMAEGYGAKCFGVEPSKMNCHRIAERGFHSLLGCAEDLVRIEANKFDIATMMWTLCNTGDCVSAASAAFNSLHEGGHIVVAESSRIMVPFKKPLHTYLNPFVSQDVHPWHFSANTLRTLLEIVGFEIVRTNRYFEQDNLIVVGVKKKNAKKLFLKDDYREVISFFNRWRMESTYFAHFTTEFKEAA